MVLALLMGIIPLPVGSTVDSPKDTSIPFPCQHHRCGCRNADQCWKKCCCFTNQQKVAWAKKHNVRLPSFVIAAAKKDKEQTPQTCSIGGCCGKSKRSNRANPCPKKQFEQLARHKHYAVTTQSTAVNDQRDIDSDIVIGILAQQCRGETTFWNSLPWSIMPPVIDIAVHRHGMVERLSLVTVDRDGRSLRPPVPPPRAV